MPATKKPTPRPRATEAARARAQDDARRLEHVGTGVRDLRRDVNRLLRDARRDLVKMRRALQRDLDRLQKDLTTAATAKPPATRRVDPEPYRQASGGCKLALMRM